MKVAFLAGFFSPAEIVIKAHFLGPLCTRQLIWIPEAGDRRDPNIHLLVRLLNQSLLNGHRPLIVHARPHDPDYNIRLSKEVSAILGKHPGSSVEQRIDIPPRETETAISAVVEWLGREAMEKLPTSDSLFEVLEGSQMVCVSQRDEPSFSSVFKNLGIARKQFDEVATELRLRNTSELVAALQGVAMPRGPLLYASHKLGQGIPQSVQYEFAGHLVVRCTTVEATVEFLQQMRGARQRQDLVEARRIQTSLMPASLLRSDDLTIACQFLPSHSVGGDFFDWFESPSGKLAVVVADVSGKGVGAALLAAQAQSLIRAAISSGATPEEAVRRVHEELLRINSSLGSLKYLELFCGVYDRSSRTLSYFYCGHTLPIIWRANATNEVLKVTGTFPGMHIPKQEVAFSEAEVSFTPGDRLLIFTDGVGEFEDHSLLMDTLNSLAAEPPEIAAQELMRFAEKRVAVFDDDATLVLIEIRIGTEATDRAESTSAA